MTSEAIKFTENFYFGGNDISHNFLSVTSLWTEIAFQIFFMVLHIRDNFSSVTSLWTFQVFFTVLHVWGGRRSLPRGSTIPQSTLRSSLLKITFCPQRRFYITEQTDQEAGGAIQKCGGVWWWSYILKVKKLAESTHQPKKNWRKKEKEKKNS